VKLDAVFFDLGMVLVSFDWELAIPRFAARSAADPARVREFLAHPYHADFERDALSEDEFFERGRDLLDFRGTREEFRSYWNEIFTEIPAGVGVLRQLATRAPVYALSNTNAWHAAYLEETFEWMQLFRGRFYSFALGARKPDPRIFQRALALANARAPHTLLIDDRLENIESARALGLPSIHAPTSAHLLRELAEFFPQDLLTQSPTLNTST
jgi:putative hydrolase of the HAD superfamily